MRLGMRALVAFEQSTKIKVTELSDEMSLETCVKLMTFALINDDPSITPERVMDLVDEYSTPMEAIDKIMECIEAAFPPSKNVPNA
jgi:hypothetical protein